MRTDPVVRRERLFIDGEWRDARNGATYERHDPFDGALVAQFADADEHDTAAALAAARRSFDDGTWRTMSAAARRKVFLRAADRLRADADAFVDILTREVGQPGQLGFVNSAAESLDYFSGVAADRRDDAITGESSKAVGIIMKEPVGVVGAIPAWNSPLSIAHKVLPAVAVGCSVVVKPSHYSPGAVLRLAEILHDCGLPSGVLSVLTSAQQDGALVGQSMVASPMVDMITFTGSTSTGRRIAASAAQTLKRVVLELGGKSPNVVFADVPSIESAVEAAVSSITMLAGQACQAGSRLLVEGPIRDEFVARVQERMSRIVVGDPFDAGVDMGPLVSRAQVERVERLVGTASGVILGGGRPTDPALDAGHFFVPTLIDHVDPDAEVAQQELFGPVLTVIDFDGVDEAIRLANRSEYGLASACWTSSLATAMAFSRGVKAGTVWVNTYRGSGISHMPTGGFKQSGLGRENGREGLEAFLETKSVHLTY